MVTLDPAPPRQLTSNELAKIFSGMLGGIAAQDPKAAADFVGLLEFSMWKLDNEAPLLPSAWSSPPSPSSWHTAMLSTVQGLTTWCRPTDIHTALLWLRHNAATLFPVKTSN